MGFRNKQRRANKAAKIAAAAAAHQANVAEYLKAAKEKVNRDEYTMTKGEPPRLRKQKAGTMPVPETGKNWIGGKGIGPKVAYDCKPAEVMQGSSAIGDLNLGLIAEVYQGPDNKPFVHTPKQAELRRPFKPVILKESNEKANALGEFAKANQKEIKETAIWAEPFKVSKSNQGKVSRILENKKGLSVKEVNEKLRKAVGNKGVSEKKGAKVRTSASEAQASFEKLLG